MTATTDFDGIVTSWLQGAGPTFVRSEVVEEALVKARRVGQRHGLAALVFGPAAWPSHRSRRLFAGLPPVVRLAVLVALTLAALVGVAAVGAQLLRQPSPPAYRGVFVPAADMAFGRINAVVVPLVDGRVLIAAGRDYLNGARPPAEIVDPTTGDYERIALEAPHGQEGGSGVLLPDGRVFMIVRDGNMTSSGAWIVDPATMTSRQLPPGGFSNAPVFGVSPSLALLLDGRVLVAGGLDDVYSDRLRSSALIFDPATEVFTPTGSMSRPRWRHSMATLPDGRVLVAGGEGMFAPYLGPEDMNPDLLGDAEIYDPATGAFTPTGGMSQVRGATVAVALSDGRVLVGPRWGVFSDTRTLGGDRRGFRKSTSALLEIYDPATGAFRLAGLAPGAATSATLLRTGKVLLTGHVGDWLKNTVRTWAATFDPERGVTELTASPLAPFAVSARLADGRVLFAGGFVVSDEGWPPPASGSLDIFE